MTPQPLHTIPHNTDVKETFPLNSFYLNFTRQRLFKSYFGFMQNSNKVRTSYRGDKGWFTPFMARRIKLRPTLGVILRLVEFRYSPNYFFSVVFIRRNISLFAENWKRADFSTLEIEILQNTQWYEYQLAQTPFSCNTRMEYLPIVPSMYGTAGIQYQIIYLTMRVLNSVNTLHLRNFMRCTVCH